MSSPLHLQVQNAIKESDDLTSIRQLIANLFEQIEESECWNVLMQSLHERVPCQLCYVNGSNCMCIAILRASLTAGMNINHVDRNGNTPLIRAIRRHYENVFILLVTLGADVNFCVSNTQLTALSIAIRYEETEGCFHYTFHLLKHGARLGGYAENWHKSIFLFPVYAHQIEFLKMLLKQFEDANRNIPWLDIFKETAEYDFEEGALETMNRGYHRWQQGRDRLTVDRECFRLATINGHQEVMSILIQWNPLVLQDSWLTRDRCFIIGTLTRDFINWMFNLKYSFSGTAPLQELAAVRILASLGQDADGKIDELSIGNLKEYMKDVSSRLKYSN